LEILSIFLTIGHFLTDVKHFTAGWRNGQEKSALRAETDQIFLDPEADRPKDL